MGHERYCNHSCLVIGEMDWGKTLYLNSELCSSAGDRLGYMAAIVCKKVIMGEGGRESNLLCPRFLKVFLK